jgi:hypothetical protein
LASATDLPVLPLAQFQPNDASQMSRLFALIKHTPQTLHYYLRQHVFPATMNFQHLKVSACGWTNLPKGPNCSTS